MTESESATAARAERAQTSLQARLQERTAQLTARFRKGQQAAATLLKALLKNPATWEVIIVTALAVIAVIIAVYLIVCTAKGICTGTDASQRSPNVGSDRDAILINLAKQGDQNAKLQYLRDHRDELIQALGAQERRLAKEADKAVVRKLMTAIGALQPGTNYADPQLAKERQKERADALAAYTEYKKICAPYQLVCFYADFANSVIGGTPYTREPTGLFLDGRGVSVYRSTPGPHNGYDVAADKGTPIVNEWTGTLREPVNWVSGEWGIPVVHQNEEDHQSYQATYGHVTLIGKQNPLTVIRSGQQLIVPVGQEVQRGDILGYVARDHVDIKWKRVVSGKPAKDWPYVDWGTFPYQTTAELTR